MSREYQAAIEREVSEWPGVSVTFEQGGKHPRAVFAFGDDSRFRPYPSTPSDFRGLRATVTDTRSVLRELGATRNERRKSTRPAKAFNPGADMRERTVEPAPVIADPWERLRGMEGKPLGAGIHRLSSAAYHADPAPEPSLSATLAKLLVKKSPAHAKLASPRLNPLHCAVDSKTFDIGRAAHRAVLGFGDDYAAIPADVLAVNGAASTAAAKAFIAETRARGATPLKIEECERVEAMAAVAHLRLAQAGIVLDPNRSELVAMAEVDAIWCRMMADNVDADPRRPIYDFKTCEDASPEACLRSVITYGYDIQAEHYRATWKAATGEDRPFVFIFQEKSAPYEVTLIRLSESFRHLAQSRLRRARKLWLTCTTTNDWPGYPVGLHEIDAPAWLFEREYEGEA